MQVVFVHGVSTRDLGDGDYERWVQGRSDRLTRLSFGGKAKIRNPYWGGFGLAAKALQALPSKKSSFAPLTAGAKTRADRDDEIAATAKLEFLETVASLSVLSIERATLTGDAVGRRQVEDFWMAAIGYAEDNPTPHWIADVTSGDQLTARLRRELLPGDEVPSSPSGRPMARGNKLALPSFDGHAFAADRAREILSGYLAQFLGDALMFFSRRERSQQVRRAIVDDIVDAARDAQAKSEPLVLIGYSMGGGILHEILTDPQEVAAIEAQLKAPLKVDLFLSVGTQIGLFAELQQFEVPEDGTSLSVPVTHYWNVFDYRDTLAFLCGPLIAGAVDLEINTAAGVVNAHGAYFESALFHRRLNAKLVAVGLVEPL